MAKTFSDVLRPSDNGVRTIKTWHDIATDEHCAVIEMRVDGRGLNRPGRVLEALDSAYDALWNERDFAALAQDYATRDRPRIGAGTLGYARRRK